MPIVEQRLRHLWGLPLQQESTSLFPLRHHLLQLIIWPLHRQLVHYLSKVVRNRSPTAHHLQLLHQSQSSRPNLSRHLNWHQQTNLLRTMLLMASTALPLRRNRLRWKLPVRLSRQLQALASRSDLATPRRRQRRRKGQRVMQTVASPHRLPLVRSPISLQDRLASMERKDPRPVVGYRALAQLRHLSRRLDLKRANKPLVRPRMDLAISSRPLHSRVRLVVGM